MTDAERLGFSAAEVHAALAQNPVAPLAWLRDRWPSLCAGVRAAAARLAPGVNVSELEARAALARHRGAMWPAVTDCVERHRRQVCVRSWCHITVYIFLQIHTPLVFIFRRKRWAWARRNGCAATFGARQWARRTTPLHRPRRPLSPAALCVRAVISLNPQNVKLYTRHSTHRITS